MSLTVVSKRGLASSAVAGGLAYVASPFALGPQGQIFIFGQVWNSQLVNGLLVAVSSYLVQWLGPPIENQIPMLKDIPFLQEILVGLTTLVGNISNSALQNANGARDLMGYVKAFGLGAFAEAAADFVLQKYSKYMAGEGIGLGFGKRMMYDDE
jgi:hypothetical protein